MLRSNGRGLLRLSRLLGAKRLFALAHRHFVSENSRAIFDRLWSTDAFLPTAKTHFQYPLGLCSSWCQRVACAHVSTLHL